MTVSVVIPAHPGRLANGLLAEALQSVWQQTQPPDAVCVAIDRTKAGAPATRQRALDMAQTEWVAFLDSDDLFEPRHLELLSQHARATGADVVYSWFTILQCFPNGVRRRLEWNSENGDGVFPPSHFTDDFDPEHPIETTITLLVRTELAQQVGMQALDRGGVNTGEDRAFIMGCLAAGAKISHLKRRTWLWRHHWLTMPQGGQSGVMGNTSGMPHKGDAR